MGNSTCSPRTELTTSNKIVVDFVGTDNSGHLHKGPDHGKVYESLGTNQRVPGATKGGGSKLVDRTPRGVASLP